MKETSLQIFEGFKCIAGKCRHSCCTGWEIDIDEDTLKFYQNIGGEFGLRLRENIDFTDGIAHFKLGAEERCPFLNKDNLCDIYINLGEENLCQICTDHPRFRSFFSDRTEIGLGLCCEAAAELILSCEEKAREVILYDDGEPEELTPWEERLLFVRKQLFSAVQNRNLPFNKRCEEILKLVKTDLPRKKVSQWAEIFLDLEQLDPQWGEILKELSVPSQITFDSPVPLPDTPFEQLLVYFLYRHLPYSEDESDLKKRTAFSVLSCRMIRALCAFHFENKKTLSMKNLIEYARMYSSETEYSEENTEYLISLL